MVLAHAGYLHASSPVLSVAFSVLGSKPSAQLRSSCHLSCRQPVSGNMPDWALTTARVLGRLRTVTLAHTPDNVTEQDQAAIDRKTSRVWAHVGVQMGEYKNNWNFVGATLPRDEKRKLRAGVRERLREVFDEEAFSVDGKVANAALDKFKRAHLVDWGDRLLLADATANAAAAEPSDVPTDEASTGAGADAALSAAEARAAAAEARAAAAEARAAVAEVALRARDAVRDDAALAAMASVLESQSEDISSTIRGMIERAAAKGRSLSNVTEIVDYAKHRMITAGIECNAAMVLQDSLEGGDEESDSDSDTVSRSRSGRPGRENTSTISDVSDNVSWNLSSISGMSLESKPKKPPELWHDLQQAIADEQKLKNKKFRKATRRFFRHLKRNFK